MTQQVRRMVKRREAAAVLEKHTGPVMEMLAQVIGDLGSETDGMRQFEQDAAYAAELSYRLDKAIPLGDPLLEALDGIVLFFVALGAIGIWRALARRDRLRGARLDRLQARLVERGPKMAKSARVRLERKIGRIQSRQ